MCFTSDDVEAITFDSFSTLVDVSSAARAVADYVDDPDAVVKCWRQRALEYSLVANGIDGYATYDELHRDGLEYALRERGLNLDDAELDDINEVYHDLDPFDDVYEGMKRLRDAGFDLYVLSNGDSAMLDSLVDSTGIGDLLDGTISADEIELFKPERALYEHAADRADTPPEAIAHVSAGWFDVLGAIHAGEQGVWIDREGKGWEPYGGEPDLEVASIHEFADELGA